MPSLDDLKHRINSVKSTQKITKAMKMVAASKLRTLKKKLNQQKPYSSRLEEMLSSLASSSVSGKGITKLSGTGKQEKYLVIPVTADRGLCGGLIVVLIVKLQNL